MLWSFVPRHDEEFRTTAVEQIEERLHRLGRDASARPAFSCRRNSTARDKCYVASCMNIEVVTTTAEGADQSRKVFIEAFMTTAEEID